MLIQPFMERSRGGGYGRRLRLRDSSLTQLRRGVSATFSPRLPSNSHVPEVHF